MFAAGDGSKESYFQLAAGMEEGGPGRGMSPTEDMSESGKNMYVYSLKAEFIYNFVGGKWKDVYGFHNINCQVKCLAASSWL